MNFPNIVFLLVEPTFEDERTFLHTIQARCGVTRHARSSVHLRTGDHQYTAYDLSAGRRDGKGAKTYKYRDDSHFHVALSVLFRWLNKGFGFDTFRVIQRVQLTLGRLRSAEPGFTEPRGSHSIRQERIEINFRTSFVGQFPYTIKSSG